MRLMIVAAAIFLSGCSQIFMPRQGSDFSYKVGADGAPSVSNKSEFESLGEKMFRKTQRYRITAQTDSGRQFHLLVAKIVQTVGDKVVSTSDAEFFPMIDGVYDYECTHHYTTPLSKDEDSVDNPVCKIELIAVFVPSAKASAIGS